MVTGRQHNQSGSSRAPISGVTSGDNGAHRAAVSRDACTGLGARLGEGLLAARVY
jgi:hypothetical protein